VIEPVSAEVSEEESNWLDRLADEVSSTDSTKWLDEAVAEMTVDRDEASAKAAPPWYSLRLPGLCGIFVKMPWN
jgi:hypothetical protein